MTSPHEPEAGSSSANFGRPEETIATPSGRVAAPPGTIAVPPPPPTRRRSWWVVAVAIVVAAAAGVTTAVVLARGEPSTAPAAGDQASPAQSPTVAAPAGLSAKATTVPLEVNLSWDAPTGTIVGYRVYRDGEQVGTVPAPQTAFTDTNVAPRRTYTYEVLARGEGVLQSERVAVTVEVHAPPLTAARVEGIYDVKVHPTSQSGFTERFGDYTTGWSFSPTCDAGACRVVWKWTVYEGIKDTLHRKGARYDGSDTGKLNVKCGSTVVKSTVTIEFKVVKARAIAGSWTATKLVGTMEQTSESQLGCVASTLKADVTAKLLS